MKNLSSFLSTVFFTLVIIMTSSIAYSQDFLSDAIAEDNTPAFKEEVTNNLRIGIKTWNCRSGGTMAMVFHLKEGDVLDSKRYKVSWYDFTGKLISNYSRTQDCLCGGAVTVVVYDWITNEYATASAPLERCKPIPPANEVTLSNSPKRN